MRPIRRIITKSRPVMCGRAPAGGTSAAGTQGRRTVRTILECWQSVLIQAPTGRLDESLLQCGRTSTVTTAGLVNSGSNVTRKEMVLRGGFKFGFLGSLSQAQQQA